MKPTKDKIFFDSNILVYSYSTSDVRKQTIARKLMLLDNRFISTQVLNETSNVLQKKYAVERAALIELATDFENHFYIHKLTVANTKKALYIAEKYKFSFYDSLIIAAAIECDCTTLYSEDMQHNLIIESTLKIINPFV